MADSPVAYYRLDESTGATATNIGSAGATINGTYVNIPGQTANNTSNYGEEGARTPFFPGLESTNNSVLFDPEDGSVGTDDTFPRVEVLVDDTGTNPLVITGALTLEAWIKRGEDLVAPSNNEGIVDRYRADQNGPARSYNLYFDSGTDGSNGAPDGTPGLGVALSTTGSFQSANSYEFAANIPIGEWTHVAAVYDPGVRVSVYVNGVLAGEVTEGITAGPLYGGEGDFWIGQQFTGLDSWSFEGNIDEVAVYDAALTDKQLLAHYLAAAPELTAYVNPISGNIVLKNDSFQNTIDMNAYQIDSPAGALLAGDDDWNSLDDQDLNSMGSGEGQSWTESPGSGSSAIGEQFLLGSTILEPGESVSIGAAYDPQVGDANMTLTYANQNFSLDPESDIKGGKVVLVLLGDMDGNGLLEDADVNPFVEALTNRASYETNNTGVDADIVGDFNGNGQLDLGDVAGFKAAVEALPSSLGAGAVPEPSTLVLLCVALVAFMMKPNRRGRGG